MKGFDLLQSISFDVEGAEKFLNMKQVYMSNKADPERYHILPREFNTYMSIDYWDNSIVDSELCTFYPKKAKVAFSSESRSDHEYLYLDGSMYFHTLEYPCKLVFRRELYSKFYYFDTIQSSEKLMTDLIDKLNFVELNTKYFSDTDMVSHGRLSLFRTSILIGYYPVTSIYQNIIVGTKKRNLL